LNLCLTSSSRCYTEFQDKQETERKKELQEFQEIKENQEMQREAGVPISVEKKKLIKLRQGPYIPTTAELEVELRKTADLRKCR
jgi:hypothetical protein